MDRPFLGRRKQARFQLVSAKGLTWPLGSLVPGRWRERRASSAIKCRRSKEASLQRERGASGGRDPGEGRLHQRPSSWEASLRLGSSLSPPGFQGTLPRPSNLTSSFLLTPAPLRPRWPGALGAAESCPGDLFPEGPGAAKPSPCQPWAVATLLPGKFPSVPHL